MTIIGVVAAMTIPTLMNTTGGQEYATGVKKALSVLSQAATMNYINNGWDYSDDDRNSNFGADLYDMLGENLKFSNCGNWKNSETELTNSECLNDGMLITFPDHLSGTGTSKSGGTTVYVDVNGTKGPNTLNTASSVGSDCKLSDIFKLTLYNQDAVIDDDTVAKCVNKK